MIKSNKEIVRFTYQGKLVRVFMVNNRLEFVEQPLNYHKDSNDERI